MWQSYGGVIFNDEGQVLLRRPTNDFGGTVWTFAKGTQDNGLSPEETAIKEVREETGYECHILGRIPGSFAGTHSHTEYFLMMPKGEPGSYDPKETQALKWVSPSEAPEYIRKTKTAKARDRDLNVLAAAVTAYAAVRASPS
jgi:8-oxo-dGTP diphosphatase